MPATIEVNKQSVKQLLESGKEHPFVIPEYQRPYAWTEEQIETLFDDLWDFTTSEDGGSDGKSTYFLGSIVAYENENGEQEIIDGQQRITSLFLLLRAIYTMLKKADSQSKEAKNFITQIEPALWRTNKLTGEVDYSNILLYSKVLNNEGNEILKSILMSGIASPNAADNYSKNYIKFQNLLLGVAQNNPLMVYEFIYVILNKAILLPITADTQDTALTIFSTLNDRGLPLSDADIFKAKIYNHLSTADKAIFIERWKTLDEQASHAGESIQQLFYYYMFYLRALEKDINSTVPGVRKYYSAQKFQRLYQPELLDNLFIILNLWKVVNRHEVLDNEPWSESISILQTLDTLTSYPNEFWKYPVITYYLTYRSLPDFSLKFEKFLNKLLKELLTKYILMPTINAVKSDIIRLNVEIISSSIPPFDFKSIDTSQLDSKIKNPHRNAVRMLLKIIAYKSQTSLLPDKWEIEHIFPQKWQTNFFLDVPDDIIKEKIEHIGNKLPFEKQLNITAGNGYFKKKKVEYAKSHIVITHDMSNSDLMDWNLDNIVERDVRVTDDVLKTLNQWENDYSALQSQSRTIDAPSPEQLAIIAQFKEKGWI